jgi:hypothetical protein
MAYTVTATHSATGKEMVLTGIVQDGVFEKTINSSPIRYFQSEGRERIELPMEHYVVRFSSGRQDIVDAEELARAERRKEAEINQPTQLVQKAKPKVQDKGPFK